MLTNPIGIFVNNFHLEMNEALQKAAELGAVGIQFSAAGDYGPDALDAGARRAFVQHVKDLGMEISAFCGDVGGFKTPEVIADHVEKTKKIIEMAADMNVHIVTGHIGAVPMAPAHPRYQMMLGALREVGDCAARNGVFYAIETGPETSSVLSSFIQDVGSPALRVNFDPANIVMITGENPAAAIYRLGDKIVHTHMKDGVMNRYVDPEIVYGCVPDVQGLVPGHRDQKPLGQGNVDFPAVFAALEAVGYRGYLTIEREGGEDRVAEITNAFHTLKNLLGRA